MKAAYNVRSFCMGVALCLSAGTSAPWSAVAASEVSPPSSPSGASQTVRLEYREVGYPVANTSPTVTQRAEPFAKEPTLGSGKVFRGTLQLGSSPDTVLAYLWDPGRGKLYLDLNGNKDLTDDTNAVFSTSTRNFSSSSQLFTNVSITLPSAQGPRRMLADVTAYGYGSQPRFYVASRWLWEGKIALQGKDWQIGVVENLWSGSQPAKNSSEPEPLRGQVLLRPWTERAEAFSSQDNAGETFALARTVFLDRQAYDVKWARVQRPSPGVEITYQEREVPTGELRLSGQHIRRLLLTGRGGQGAVAVVLNQPGASTPVPLGSYDHYEVSLRQGKVAAVRQPDYSRPPNVTALKVVSNQPAMLAVGGPLTNTVAVSRHGKALSLSYKLVGAGGESYQLVGPRQQPLWSVYQGDKRIASGKFEFG